MQILPYPFLFYQKRYVTTDFFIEKENQQRTIFDMV